MVIRTRDRIFFTENLIEIRKEQQTSSGERTVVVTLVPVNGVTIQLEGDEAIEVWGQLQSTDLVDTVKSLLNG